MSGVSIRPDVLRDVPVAGDALLLQGQRPASSRESGQRTGSAGHADPTMTDQRLLAREEGLAEGLAAGRRLAADELQSQARSAADRLQRELAAATEHAIVQASNEVERASVARLERLDALLAALPAEAERRLSACEDDAVALCFDVICRLLGTTAPPAAAVAAQVETALREFGGRAVATIHVHPDDLAALGREPAWPELTAPGAAATWIGNPEVRLGGCILQSPEGSLDARLETRLRLLVDALRQARSGPPPVPRTGVAEIRR